jgi:hypothetical protein
VVSVVAAIAWLGLVLVALLQATGLSRLIGRVARRRRA